MSADVHPTPFFHDKNHQTSLSIDTIQDFNTSPRSHSTPRRSAPHSPTQSHSLPSPTESSPSTPLRSEQMEHNESTESTENSDSSETTDSTESTNENQDEEPKAKVIYHCTICGRDRHLVSFIIITIIFLSFFFLLYFKKFKLMLKFLLGSILSLCSVISRLLFQFQSHIVL